MKKLLSLKTLLICISFTVFLLLVKDNMNVVWSAIGWITGIITPFAYSVEGSAVPAEKCF